MLTKIKSSFHSQQKREILHLQDKLLIKEKFGAKDYVPNIMDSLLKSSVSKRLTEILYQNTKGDEPNSRTAEPIGVFNENGNWYLVAYCHSRSDYRNFRLDRIQQLVVLEKHFENEHPSINELIGLYHSRYFTEITVRINQKYAHFLSFERHNFGYVKETVTEESGLTYFKCKAHPTSFLR